MTRIRHGHDVTSAGHPLTPIRARLTQKRIVRTSAQRLLRPLFPPGQVHFNLVTISAFCQCLKVKFELCAVAATQPPRYV